MNCSRVGSGGEFDGAAGAAGAAVVDGGSQRMTVLAVSARCEIMAEVTGMRTKDSRAAPRVRVAGGVEGGIVMIECVMVVLVEAVAESRRLL